MSQKSSSAINEAKHDDKIYSLFTSSTGNLPNEQLIEEIFREHATKHAEDAVDYEDIDELADDEMPMDLNEGALNSGMVVTEVDNGYDEKELQQQADLEFDNMFNDDDMGILNDNDHMDVNNTGNDRLFGDLNENMHLDDHDLQGLDLEIFGEDRADTYHKGEAKKHRLDNEELNERRRHKRAKLEEAIKKLEVKKTRKQLAYYFPEFSKGESYNNHLLFLLPPKYYTYKIPPIALKSYVKPLIPKKISLEIEEDQKKIFKSRKLVSRYVKLPSNKHIRSITEGDFQIIKDIENNGSITTPIVKTIDFLSNDGANNDKFMDFSKDLILTNADWDDDAIINAGDENSSTIGRTYHSADLVDIDSDSSYDDNIYEGQIADRVRLDMNDPNLLFIPDKSEAQKHSSLARLSTSEKMIESKFNISNDNEYEILKNNYVSKVRSQLSNLNIEHSLPAVRLQTPYYKVKLNSQEARAFHRPSLNIRQGTLISFSKVKTRKKKKDRGKSAQELFSKSSDLTLADSAMILGMEYSEEYPLLLSNFGMGSKLINYYRKEKDDDYSRPKVSLGETHVLGVEDRSPFWNFGYVAKGDFVPTLYNNFVRAPVFKHDTKHTDFLLLRSQGAGSHQKYYLRSINHMFSVGNLFPAMEVPAPHSRKVTNTSKNRLKMIVFRAMNMNEENRVSVKDISHHFPDQNDMQNRQRLKEFMEYQRHGEDQGYWKIKNSDIVPSEEEIKVMVTPEDVVILDSMQHGQQVLEDATFLFGSDPSKNEKKDTKRGKEESNDKDQKDKKDDEKDKPKAKSKEKDSEKERDFTEEDAEESLTPWSLTRNFVNATQSKSMLQLNGEGDPTGIGLGFSFLRASQKHSFSPLFPPPKENVPKNSTAAYQQKLYEEEITRIWYAQRRSLTVEPLKKYDLLDIYREYKPADHYDTIKAKIGKERDPDVDQGLGVNEKKALRITRRFRDKNGILQRRVDTITDTRIIGAYMRRRKQIEDEKLLNAELNDIIPTNDKELNKLRRKALEEKLASLEKKARLGRGRKSSKETLHAAAAVGGTVIDANTVKLPDGSFAIGGKGIGKGKSKTRQCASCGAYGHIRTNKACPLYYQTIGKDQNPSSPEQNFSHSPTPFGI